MNEDLRDKNSHGATETQSVAGTQSDKLSNQTSPEKNILEQEQKMSFGVPRPRASARGNWKRVKLGEVAEEYSVRNKDKRLSNVFSVTNSQGFTPSTDYFKKEVFSKELSTYKIVEEGMLAYNPSRINVGSVACLKLSERVIVSPLYVVVSINRYLVSPSFLEYALHSEFALSQIASLTSGSVRDSLKYSAFEKIEIPLPPLEEQRRIAGTLDKVRELIDLRERELAKFDELVKCRFIEMFSSVENNRLGIKTVKIKDACELINGKAFKPEDWSDKGLPIVRIQNLNNEQASFNYFRGEVKEQYLIDTGELLFSWSGTPGTSFGAFFWNRGKAVLNQHIFRVKPKVEFNLLFLQFALNGRIDFIISKAHGGVGLQHITKKELDEVELLLPPIERQNEFAAFVALTDKSKFAVRQSLEKLKICYKSLMQEYFG